jgi:hypothetical protein
MMVVVKTKTSVAKPQTEKILKPQIPQITQKKGTNNLVGVIHELPLHVNRK